MSRCNNPRACIVYQGGRVTITIHDNHSLSGFKEPEIMTYSLPWASDFITALSLWGVLDGTVLHSRLQQRGCQTSLSLSSSLSGMFTGCVPPCSWMWWRLTSSCLQSTFLPPCLLRTFAELFTDAREKYDWSKATQWQVALLPLWQNGNAGIRIQLQLYKNFIQLLSFNFHCY